MDMATRVQTRQFAFLILLNIFRRDMNQLFSLQLSVNSRTELPLFRRKETKIDLWHILPVKSGIY